MCLETSSVLHANRTQVAPLVKYLASCLAPQSAILRTMDAVRETSVQICQYKRF